MFNDYYSGKRVLVTGHTGFKGSWLMAWLEAIGAKVTGFSLGLPTNPCHFSHLEGTSEAESVEGDILDIGKLRKCIENFRPQVVFHLAAQPIVSLSIADPVLTFETNVLGTCRVLECLRDREFIESAVIITSDKCYENVEWEFGYRETDRLGGKDPYSASKAGAELVFSSYFRSFFAREGLKIASARAGNVIGGGDWAKDRLVPDVMVQWAKGQTPVIRNPRSTRPWQHVLEPLSGYLQLASCLGSPDRYCLDQTNGESFNFGPYSRNCLSVSKLLELMSENWGGHRWEEQAPSSSGLEAGLLALNTDKSFKRLGWTPLLEPKQAIEMTVSWYRAYYEGGGGIAQTTKEQIASFCQTARDKGAVWADGKDIV